MKSFLICFLPVLFLDMFTWRDLGLHLGKDELLYTDDAWVTRLYFMGEDQMQDSLSHVSELRMDNGVFTGKTADEYFIVNRETGKADHFSSSAKREVVLKQQFNRSLDDLSEPPWYAGVQDFPFYPYNLAYYAIITVFFFFRTFKKKADLQSNCPDPIS